METPINNTPTGDTRWFDRLLAWEPQTQAVWMRFGVAIGLTLLALLLRTSLAPAESGGRFITFSLAGALAALYGGFACGMVSTLLGMVLLNFFLIAPPGTFAIHDPVEAFWLNLWHLATQVVVVGAIGLMQTKNRRLQEAGRLARQSQQYFLDTFNHAAAGIVHADLEGRIIRVNQTFCDLLGYNVNELLHTRFHDITYPEDVAPNENLLSEALAEQRRAYSLNKRYRHKNGSTVWMQLTVAMIQSAENTPAYLVAVVQDTTALKAVESALRDSERLMLQAQKLAGFARWRADIGPSEGQFHALGDSYRSLGLLRSEFSGEELWQLVDPADQARLWQDWTDALSGARPFDASYRARVHGEERWFSMQAEFERDAGGRVVRAFGITQDITQRKQAEREVLTLNATLEHRIQERTRELKDAYDELESYSYAVAHDLRSPLRLINGFAQAIEEDSLTLDADSRSHLARIKAASRKMGELIDGLLKLSQYGRGELQRQPVNVSALATRLLEELASEDPQREVQWEIEPGLALHADPALAEALMQNLLHNAWKYSARVNPAQIRVFRHEIDGENHVCVSDNGAGFDMARAGKLFQPFQRMHLPHEFSGLGIGLATVRRIVLRHGGQLHAQSAPGEGATFCFTLPDEVAPRPRLSA